MNGVYEVLIGAGVGGGLVLLADWLDRKLFGL